MSLPHECVCRICYQSMGNLFTAPAVAEQARPEPVGWKPDMKTLRVLASAMRKVWPTAPWRRFQWRTAMTTKVTIHAHAGWPVKVTKIMYKPGEETGREDVIVPANTQQDFYVHSTMRIAVEEGITAAPSATPSRVEAEKHTSVDTGSDSSASSGAWVRTPEERQTKRCTVLSALCAMISDYVADYDMENDVCGYTPTEGERAMIHDAIHGLIAEGEFMRLWAEWRALCDEPPLTRGLPTVPSPIQAELAGSNQPSVSSPASAGEGELVRQIRAFLADAPKGKPHEGYRYGELLSQAADEIESLRRKLADAERERNSVVASFDSLVKKLGIAESRIATLEAALVELIACKDLKAGIGRLYVDSEQAAERGDEELAERLENEWMDLVKEYDRRKPLAWEAARAATRSAGT